MAETSGPFDGSPWAESEWYKYMPAAMKSGVIGTKVSGTGNGALAFSPSGLQITLAAGDANVGGAGYSRSAPLSAVAVPANTNSSLSRRDRIVLRRSLSTHNVTPVVIQGTPAASPSAPAITRNSTTFDLQLFSFLTPPNSGSTLSSVTDERVWVDAGAVSAPTGPHLLTDTTSATTIATGTTRVTVSGLSGNITLDETRWIKADLSMTRCLGISGGELGRLILRINGGEVRDAQWRNAVADAPGEVSATVTWSQTLAAGTHSFDAAIIRVSGGTQVECREGLIVVYDGGPA